MGKFVRWLGIYHQMLADPRPGGRRSYWSNRKDWECLGRSSYDLKDVMDMKEFEHIYTAFGIPIGAPDDAHGKVRGFVDAWNSQCKKALSPGWCLVIDESMVKWRGRGMPGKIFVPRKPEPLEFWNNHSFKHDTLRFLECIIRMNLPHENVTLFAATVTGDNIHCVNKNKKRFLLFEIFWK